MADTYVNITFVADELLTSTKMNQLAANQAGFHSGSALGDGIIVSRHINGAAVTASKIDFATFKSGNYSNTEVATEYKWIDGKTIYKKTITFNSGTAASMNHPHGLSIGTAIDIQSSLGSSIPAIVPYDMNFSIAIYFTDVNISVRRGGSATTGTVIATLYYTKP